MFMCTESGEDAVGQITFLYTFRPLLYMFFTNTSVTSHIPRTLSVPEGLKRIKTGSLLADSRISSLGTSDLARHKHT